MKIRLGTLVFVFFATLVFSTWRVAPAVADDASDAKMHYQKATAHYAVGEYHEAALEYEAAYKSKQDPALLYNAAQSHRLAGDNQKALLLYRNIVKLHPTSKYAVESKDRIVKLEQAIATTTSPPNQPAPVETGGTTAPVPAAPPPVTAPVQPLAAPPASTAAAPAPLPVAPAPAASVTATAAPAPAAGGETPVYEKWWFWAGAGVVVVGAIVAVAVLSSSTTPWTNVPNVNGSVR
jgi:tetratricopeptide (TPR) repeat protein